MRCEEQGYVLLGVRKETRLIYPKKAADSLSQLLRQTGGTQPATCDKPGLLPDELPLLPVTGLTLSNQY